MSKREDCGRAKDDAWKAEHRDDMESVVSNSSESGLGGSSKEEHESGAKPSTSSKEKYQARGRAKKRDTGRSAPLSVLAQKEKELHTQDSFRKRLGPAIHASPDVNLTVQQVANTISRPGLSSDLQDQIRKETVSLYAALDPIDPVDSMLARQLVALNNATMGCFERAARTTDCQARDIELRHGINGTKAFGSLLQLREARESRRLLLVKIDDGETRSGQLGHGEARPKLPVSDRRIDERAGTPKSNPPKRRVNRKG